MSIPGDDPAFLFEDRQTPGDWHVQWTDNEGASRWRSFPAQGRANGPSSSRSGATAVTKKSALTEVRNGSARAIQRRLTAHGGRRTGTKVLGLSTGSKNASGGPCWIAIARWWFIPPAT